MHSLPPLTLPQLQRLVTANAALAAQPDFRNVMNLKSLDVIATRLFFDRKVHAGASLSDNVVHYCTSPSCVTRPA